MNVEHYIIAGLLLFLSFVMHRLGYYRGLSQNDGWEDEARWWRERWIEINEGYSLVRDQEPEE